MGIIGVRDLKTIGLPDTWSASEVLKTRLASGETFADFMRTLGAAIPALNTSLVTGEFQLLGRLVAYTTDDLVEYPSGTQGNGVRRATEYADPIPSRGAVAGHMLPIEGWEVALGWTVAGLRKARQSQLDADVRAAVTDMKEMWQKLLLQRLFQMEPDPVGTITNASPGFADGGLATTQYAPPPSPRGMRFSNTHNHYLRLATLDENAVKQAVEHLWEHGHNAPYTIVASWADRATWAGMPGWVKPTYPGIRPATTETRLEAPTTAPYDGYLEVDTYGIAQVVFSPLVPGGYFAVYREYGVLDSRNPLRVRWDDKLGVGWNLWPGRDFGKRALAMFYAEFGVGVGADRTNGVCVKIASSGAYTSPQIA